MPTASRLEEENENKNNNTLDDDSDDMDVDVTRLNRHTCVTCRKRFTSQNRFEIHCQSHRHLQQQQRHSATSGNPFRMLEPIPANVIASLSPMSSPTRTSPKSMSSPNAISSSTSATKKERTFRVS